MELQLHRARESSARLGHPVTAFFNIIDCAGVGTVQSRRLVYAFLCLAWQIDECCVYVTAIAIDLCLVSEDAIDTCMDAGMSHMGFLSFLNAIHQVLSAAFFFLPRNESPAYYFRFLLFGAGICQFDEEMHPGRLFKSMLVNVPFGFATMWKVIASFMSEQVSSKVQGL